MNVIRLNSTFWAKQDLILTISRNIPEAFFTVLARLEEKKMSGIIWKERGNGR
jgi:hypothetical protein